MDREATSKQMQVEAHSRDFLENSKKEMHQQATNELQKDLDRMEQDNARLLDGKKAPVKPIVKPKVSQKSKFRSQLNEDIFGANDAISAP